ncbi:MAG: tetratricopeptide repeat protein [Limisphaerales bacterium]
MQGPTEEAIRQFQEAIRLKLDYADAHYNLHVALHKQGQMDEAIRQFRETLRLKTKRNLFTFALGYGITLLRMMRLRRETQRQRANGI